MLAVATTDSLTLWDVSDKNNSIPLSPALTSQQFPNDFQNVAFAPSGAYLLGTIPRVGVVSLFSVDKRLETSYVGLPGTSEVVTWTPDGRGIAIGRTCGMIYYCHD
jgi:hypothetical protein